MTTNHDQFETHYTLVRNRLQVENDQSLAYPRPKLAPDNETREYFAVLYQYAPTIAATPIVAAAWIKNVLQTRYIGPADISALCRIELDARKVRESERRRLLEAWHLLMRDPADINLKAIRKIDQEEYDLRVNARAAVIEWLRHRPDLDGLPPPAPTDASGAAVPPPSPDRAAAEVLVRGVLGHMVPGLFDTLKPETQQHWIDGGVATLTKLVQYQPFTAETLANLADAVSYELDPHQWTPEYMDEQHWIGVCAVMPYAEQLIQMAGAIHALAQPR